MSGRSESVEGVLRQVFHRLFPEATAFFTPFASPPELLKSRGVHLLDDFIGRRSVLAFWIDWYTATLVTGYPGSCSGDPLRLCICAAEPTTDACCRSKDFFVCVSSTEDYQKVQIFSMFTLTQMDDGSLILVNSNEYMCSVVQSLVGRYKEAYDTAIPACLEKYA